MFNYVIKNESCVNMKSEDSAISADVLLMNGVTPQEFIKNMQEQVSDSSDVNYIDICTMLGDNGKAYDGKLTFTNVGKYYAIFDDIEWLKVIDVRDMCLFIEGKIDRDGIEAISDLLREMIPNSYQINVFYTDQKSEAKNIKINILLARKIGWNYGEKICLNTK